MIAPLPPTARAPACVRPDPAAAPLRLLYVIAQSVRWIAFEWIAEHLDRARFDLEFLLLNPAEPPLQRPLEAHGRRCHPVPFHGKFDTIPAARAVQALCRRRRFDLVHCHFMGACLSGLPGAALAGVPIRLHTRHHAGPFNRRQRPWWGRFYDQFNNRLSTHIVAPSGQVERVLTQLEGVPPRKITRLDHGFDLPRFSRVDPARTAALRQKYPALAGRRPVIGVVARFEEIKGVAYIIRAFRALLPDFPQACLVLANARGRAAEALRGELAALPAGSFLEIPFEEEMPALYPCFDLFAHTPIAPHLEAFGQVYVEAWAAGVPSVITPAGIAAEVARHGENAWVAGFQDESSILAGFRALLASAELRTRLSENARCLVHARFGLTRMIDGLEALYLAATAAVRRAG